VFSVWSVPSLYNENKLPLRSLETAARWVGGWCEMVASLRRCEPGSSGKSTGEDSIMRRVCGN
jgi:hypothetical protein